MGGGTGGVVGTVVVDGGGEDVTGGEQTGPLPVVKLTNHRYLRREGPLHALNYFDITNFLVMPQQRVIFQLATNKAFVERHHHVFFAVP